ncbi:MAG TPA: nitrilase-related carbon-nitrogen hydrolase, partial [Thermomicrobiales bacterium]|nr:nitrilase-related carbon-nitrogen hydrolase [Thermomicrobiales bacterium]
VYGEVDIARARDKRPRPSRAENLLADRRPELYGNLTLNAYLWNAREFHGLYDLRPLPEGRRSRVAVAQFAPAAGDIAANLAQIEAALTESGAELLVAPELSVTGPVADRAAAERLAEPMSGPIVARLREIAARHRAFVVGGLIERDGADLFNTAALVGPAGLVGRYRKTHLADEDRAWAAPGDGGLPTFDLPVGRIGLLIGYDALFPEAARSLALDGADLIACPSLLDWPRVQPWGATAIPLPPFLDAGPTADHFHLWRERGRENNTYIAFANGAAPWMGWSGVFGAAPEDEPRQEAVIAGAAPGVAALTIDTTNLDARSTTNPVRAKDLVRMRMPIWYDPLQAPASGRAAATADAREPVAAGAGSTARA